MERLKEFYEKFPTSVILVAFLSLLMHLHGRYRRYQSELLPYENQYESCLLASFIRFA